MIIYPAIDLKEGKCVRLKKGDFTQATYYSEQPENMIELFAEAGATWIHIVDLDGAKNGRLSQIKLLKQLRKKFNFCIQFGGGIRSKEDAALLLDIGVDRIILGSICITDYSLVEKLINQYSFNQFVFALDVNSSLSKNPVVAFNGWQKNSSFSLWQILDKLPQNSHILCTDISRDGMQTGANLALYQKILSFYPMLQLQASGGVSSITEIENLKKNKIAGCVIGKAIYENTINLKDVFQC